MHEMLTESSAYKSENEIEKVIHHISRTIDGIREGHQEIKNYKSRGLPTDIWLRDTMDRATKTLTPKDRTNLIVTVKQALSQSNSGLFSMLTSSDTTDAIVPELVNSDFSGIDKTGIAQNFAKEMQVNSCLGTISFEEMSLPTFTWDTEIESAKNYFESVLDAQSDDDFKKVVSTGIELAKEHELLPDTMSKISTAELAAIVDKSVSTAKVAYKVAQGEIDVTAATDYLIDRTTASVGTIIKHGCEHYGGVTGTAVGGVVGGMVGVVLGPQAAVIGAKIGHILGKFAGKIVGEVLVEGVKKIANAAKTVFSTCCEGIKNVGNSIKEGFSSVWKWCTS